MTNRNIYHQDDKVTSLENLTASLKRVLSNGGSAGLDGMTVKGLQDWFSGHYNELSGQLKTNDYRVSTIRGVKIPNGSLLSFKINETAQYVRRTLGGVRGQQS